jgi:hypothetical protein
VWRRRGSHKTCRGARCKSCTRRTVRLARGGSMYAPSSRTPSIRAVHGGIISFTLSKCVGNGSITMPRGALRLSQAVRRLSLHPITPRPSRASPRPSNLAHIDQDEQSTFVPGCCLAPHPPPSTLRVCILLFGSTNNMSPPPAATNEAEKSLRLLWP